MDISMVDIIAVANVLAGSLLPGSIVCRDLPWHECWLTSWAVLYMLSPSRQGVHVSNVILMDLILYIVCPSLLHACCYPCRYP